jgi:hypothetical protein
VSLLTTESFDDVALAACIAAATVLGADLKAGLFTNTPVLSKTNLVADFVEPVWATYVRQAVVMAGPFRDPALGIASLSASLIWQQTGTPTPCVIKGIFYTYGAGPLVMGAEIFATPIPLNDILDAFTSILEFVQSNSNPGFTTVVQ